MTMNGSPQRTLDDFIDMIQERPEDHDQLKRKFQQEWGEMMRVYMSACSPKTSNDIPLAPSSEVIDFAIRAWSNPNFRALMGRLANE